MYDGKLITDKQNISDVMNMHFCNVGKKLQSQLQNCMLNFKDSRPAKIKNVFFLTPISKEDILLEIKNLKQNKAPGHPNDMKIAKFIALFKKGKKFDPTNYRPISLLSHFDKMLKRYYVKDLSRSYKIIKCIIVISLDSERGTYCG